MKSLSSIRPLACVILAAGQGTRMRSSLPKVLHPIGGVPMVCHVIGSCESLGADKIVVVVAPDSGLVMQAVKPHIAVVQPIPQGTADAVKAARDEIRGVVGDVIVLFGDTPLVTPEALQALREKRTSTGATIVVAGFRPENPGNYGRLVVDADGDLLEIVEAADATSEQKAIRLCNGGIMLFDGEALPGLLDAVKNNNVKGEYYLTDCIKIAKEKGLSAVVTEMHPDNVLGVNTRVELASAETILQRRLRHKAMLGGVTMQDPDTVYLSMDTVFGHDVVIEPNVVFGPHVQVEDNVRIRAFSYLEGKSLEKGTTVGPFFKS